MNTGTTMIRTPWGWTQDVEELAEGIRRVSTPSHGGLKLSRERWQELPDLVRDSFLTPTFAEEDCEEPIARTLLGIGDGRDGQLAISTAIRFPRYAPALPYLREIAPHPHFHVITHFGGYATDPFGRFNTREQAEAFASDADNGRKYGRMEAVECSKANCGRGGP